VDLEPFPVVLEPEGFFVPLAVSFAVLEALSPLLLLSLLSSLLLLSPVAVGFAAVDVFAGYGITDRRRRREQERR
jgi:hypothetical protein